jgi:hypothetical protein
LASVASSSPVKYHEGLRDQPQERLALHVSHGEEAQPVGLFDGVDRDDVRVVERGERPRLALEPLQTLGALGELSWKQLEGDLASQPRVLGPSCVARAS